MLTGHRDAIRHVAHNSFGDRLATCSSDHVIKIWEMDPETQNWVCKHELKDKGHTGSIWKVVWARPDFGNILASCSFDRTVIIWEEVLDDNKKISTWVRRTALVDSRDSVCDIDFSPAHLGLRIAASCLDGYVRIYEAHDPSNISHWSLFQEIEVGLATKLSWSASKYAPPMLVVGDETGRVYVYGASTPQQGARLNLEFALAETHVHGPAKLTGLSFAPHIGQSYAMFASASADGSIRLWARDENKDGFACIAMLLGHTQAVHHLEWNVMGNTLASSSNDGTIRVWKPTSPRNWVCSNVYQQQ